eukprot:gene9639-1843_t
MTEDVDYRELVVELRQKSENKTCADCGGSDAKWTSTNLGIFLCPDCSGVHRNLGTHITKVRSTILDQWDKTLYEGMLKGNLLNDEYEKYIFPHEKPNPSDPQTLKGKFANEKYVNKTYTKERKFDKSFGEKKGFLTKRGSHWKTWKKRFFILENGKLKYFKSEKDKKEAGFLVIDDKSTVEIIEESDYKNTFKITTGNRVLDVYAESESDMVQWIFALRANILH